MCRLFAAVILSICFVFASVGCNRNECCCDECASAAAASADQPTPAPKNTPDPKLNTMVPPSMPPRLGEFDAERDIGKVDPPGTSAIDRAAGKYTIKSGGANIWFKQDDFHFAFKKASGDIVMSAEIEFVGEGKNPHRKAGLMIRQDLDADSAYVDVVQHGDGTIALQYRKAKGDDTYELKSHVKAPATVRIERHGTTNTVYVTPKGGKTETVTPIEIELKDPVYIGLAVSAHDPSAAETAVISNVKVTAGK
ncbi:MAG TPA: hypothetical protein VKX17_17910 [Planctomycetota bacterium]|nr:hypothetical protein [Planctomycetota bacterium]